MTPAQLVEWLLHEAHVPPASEVCSMKGRGYAQCWGCPVLECPRHLTPFEIAAEDETVLDRAVAKLKANVLWVGGVSGRKLYERLAYDPDSDTSSDEHAKAVLLSLFLESRQDYLDNLAVERAALGLDSIEEAASRVRTVSRDIRQDRNVLAFTERVENRLNSVGYIAPGRQHHTAKLLYGDDVADTHEPYVPGLSDDSSMGLEALTVTRRVRNTDGAELSLQGALTWEEYEARQRERAK